MRLNISKQFLAEIASKVRIACLKTATLFPNLDGKSPIIFVEISNKKNFEEDEMSNSRPLGKNQKNLLTIVKTLPENSKALIALKPFNTMNKNKQNYTCAYFDDQICK